MKHFFKRGICLVLAIVLVIGLTACGNKVGDIALEAGRNAIYIEEDGTVFYGVAEKFAENYYDEDELEDEISAEVESYNKSSRASVGEAVSIEEFDVDDKVASLILLFKTVYDFNVYIKEYNKESKNQFYAGTIRENVDCKIKGEFVTPDRSETIKAKDINTMKDSNILIVNNQYKVQVASDVKYMSSNCSIDEDGIITTAKAENGLSYIIY